MKNIFSFLDFIDNNNNIIFQLGKKFQSKYAVYLIEEFMSPQTTIIDGISYTKASRYPKINLHDIKLDIKITNHIKLNRVNIYKVLNRFASQLDLRSQSDFESALNSLIYSSYKIIRANKTDLILFNDFPHTPFEIVTYYIAKIMEIETFFLFPIPRINPIEERFFLTEDFTKLPSNFWKEFNNISHSLGTDSKELSPDLIKYYQEYSGEIKSNKYYFGNKTNKFVLLKRYMRRFPINIRERGLKLSLFQAFKRFQYFTPIHEFNKNSILNYAEKLSLNNPSIDDDAFLFLALHYQPEATTIPWGDIYSDQLFMIIEISKALPEGYLLYVKEHPTYWTNTHIENFGLYRSKSFYKKIAELKNVRFISYKIPSFDIINKAKCIITVTGTIAWESFFKNVPCIVLGDIYYKEFPTSTSPDRFNHNLSLTIQDALSKIGHDYSEDFKKFLIAFDKTTILTNNPISLNHSWDNPTLEIEEESRYSTTNRIKADYIYNQLK